ncbi:MAG TPA: SpoIID/LytB domain-containing protein [Pyrinomonadaceae bacterium]
MPSRRLVVLSILTICILIPGWSAVRKGTRHSSLFVSPAGSLDTDNVDQTLQRTAILALGDRRGAIIVMDPQTGRVRAVVNSELAFEENLPPGSTIKPFTALAALRSGVIDEESRTLCREKYAHEDFHTTCSHPRDLPSLNPTEAIAYSCNYFFGKVGERLDESNFRSTISEFGFGKPSGVNASREAQGLVGRTQWHSQNAIGEGDYLRATPIQLIDAYSALVNGGYLFTPQIASVSGFVPELRTRLTIKDEHRHLILKGMRGAVRYGTAESANLYSLPIYVFGKTGTATEINGYRTQGWFVGFSSELDEREKDESEFAPERVRLAVLVFLAKAHGSEAAEVARPIFDAYAHSSEISEISDLKSQIPNHGFESSTPSAQSEMSNQESEMSNQESGISDRRSQISERNPKTVTVHLVRENITRTMPLEDYVRGVVAAEGSMESEPEALKALAVASRTYVLKNLGRHAKDGYDFCTTTHCQRYRPVDSGSLAGVSSAVIAAVESTKGETLRDSNNELADSYFSASCGGATANLATLWGGNAPSYLRGVHDEYCESGAHHSWTDVITRQQMLKALQSDPRTNIGERLVDVSVARSDASGRAELITVEGNRRVTVKGWDFKIIIGRALGWNLLKSSRFKISHSGSNFVFRGSGFGHGLGLCQEGAHVMATRGASYRQILSKYFPGTDLSRDMEIASVDGTAAVKDPEPSQASVVEKHVSQSRAAADILWNNSRSVEIRTAYANHSLRPISVRHTLSSEDFHISYPQNVSQREAEGLLSFLQSSRELFIARVAAAGITTQLPPLEIFINETTGDFVGRTGQPAWAAAATKGSRIELQPLALLKRRRILETTLRHELVHTLVDIVGRGRAPRWLAEGLALHLAGEGRLVAAYEPRERLTTNEIEKRLSGTRNAKSPNDMRAAYAAAYGEVKRLINTEGEANVWRLLAKKY